MKPTVAYTGFDKVSKVKQGNDSICYSYGYDRQRILMEERVGSLTRTKQYWGACEYVTEEYEYTPNNTSGGFDNGWGNTSSWSSDRRLRGSGGGNGNHGGSSNVQPNQNTNLEIASDVLITANLYTSTEATLHYNPFTKTWKDKLNKIRDFDFHGNGATGGMNSYGKAMSNRYLKASGWLNGLGIGLSTVQMVSAESIDDKIRYGSDVVFGIIGFAPGGNMISTFWFFGGRELVFQYGETMGTLLEDGINPGYPVYQPFK